MANKKITSIKKTLDLLINKTLTIVNNRTGKRETMKLLKGYPTYQGFIRDLSGKNPKGAGNAGYYIKSSDGEMMQLRLRQIKSVRIYNGSGTILMNCNNLLRERYEEKLDLPNPEGADLGNRYIIQEFDKVKGYRTSIVDKDTGKLLHEIKTYMEVLN